MVFTIFCVSKLDILSVEPCQALSKRLKISVIFKYFFAVIFQLNLNFFRYIFMPFIDQK